MKQFGQNQHQVVTVNLPPFNQNSIGVTGSQKFSAKGDTHITTVNSDIDIEDPEHKPPTFTVLNNSFASDMDMKAGVDCFMDSELLTSQDKR